MGIEHTKAVDQATVGPPKQTQYDPHWTAKWGQQKLAEHPVENVWVETSSKYNFGYRRWYRFYERRVGQQIQFKRERRK